MSFVRWSSASALVAVAALLASSGPSDAASELAAPRTAAAARPPEHFAGVALPCDFEANRGQTAAEVDYLARCAGYVAFLTKGDAVIRTERDAFRLHLVGGRAAKPSASVARPGRSNYLIGKDAARWHTEVSRWGRVEYDEVRPGVDVAYRTQGRAIAFDLLVAPGADTDSLAIRLDGVAWAGPDADGNLSIGLASGGAARLSKPRAWQDIDGVRREVTVAFAEGAARNEVAFAVGKYDRTRPLVIDPVLTVSTYLGGSALDTAFAVATGPTGAIHLVGTTGSTDFPVTTGALQTTKGETSTALYDAFVTKLDPSGTQVVWSTYLGGNSADVAQGVAVDSSGNVYVGGVTNSTNFPLASAYQTSVATGFLTKLGSSGASLVWSTYYDDAPSTIGLDSGGSLHGFSTSGRTFVINSAGTTVGYSVTIGGFNPPQFNWSSMAVDPSGAVWLGGRITSSSLATAGALQTAFGGGSNDCWLVKLNTSGTEVYRTYLGGNGDDYIRGLGLDSFGNVLVVGTTTSTNFPVSSAAQSSLAGQFDGFVAKLNSTGTSIVFSTYIGGSLDDTSNCVAANSSGSVFVGGYTASTNFPTSDAFQTSFGGGNADVTLTEFTSTGTLTRSTYLGGNGTDTTAAIGISSLGRPLLVGGTRSSNFPLACAHDSSLGGTDDAFLAGIASGSATFGDLSPATLPGATIGRDYSTQLTIGGGTAPLTWTLHQGPLPAGLSLSSAGVLSGTPTATGATSFFVRIDDSANACAIREYRVTVNAQPSVPAATLPAWTQDRPYSKPVPVDGGTAPFTWELLTGIVPPGTSLTEEGLLDGTPTVPGDYTFSVSVVDAQGASAAGPVSIHINAPPSVATPELPAWTQLRPYARTLAGADGTTPYTWSLAAGELPIGDDIASATGAIEGTTLLAGDYTFTARLTDAAGATAEREFTVHLNASPQMTSPTLPIAVFGRPYAAGPSIAGGTAPFTWSLTSGTLPAGFFGFGVGTGVVSGTPTEIGREPVGYMLSDVSGAVNFRNYMIVVAPLLDVSKGSAKKETIGIVQEDSTKDVIRCVEAIAGTALDVTVKQKTEGEFAFDLLLLDGSETPLDLAAFTTLKGRTLKVKGFPLPATGRYFVVVRPTQGFEGSVTLDISVKPPKSPRGESALDPAGDAITVPFAVLEGSKVVIAVKAAKGSLAVPTITSLKDADGNELLVADELRTSAKGATLKVRTPLAGGDYVATFESNGGAAGDIRWTIAVDGPRKYAFEMTDVPVTGE